MTDNLEKIREANAKADPIFDQLCDWVKSSQCSFCWFFVLFAAGFIGGCIIRGWFA